MESWKLALRRRFFSLAASQTTSVCVLGWGVCCFADSTGWLSADLVSTTSAGADEGTAEVVGVADAVAEGSAAGTNGLGCGGPLGELTIALDGSVVGGFGSA